MDNNIVMHVVASECRSDVEEKYNKWYDEVHIPAVMKYKGCIRATRLRRLDDKTEWPKYLVLYEYENKEAADGFESSPEFAAGWEELQETWKDGGLDLKWMMPYERIGVWEK